MKGAAFLGVAGGVGAIFTKFVPELPGLEDTIVVTGAVAAIAGAAIGIPIRKRESVRIYLFVGIMSVACFILGLIMYLRIAAGEPGAEAASWAYIWTVAMFGPIGLLVQLAGLKFTDE